MGEQIEYPKFKPWRLNAGDEHTVMDERGQKLVSVPCGGMSGRTVKEGAEVAALIAMAPELRAHLEWAAKVLSHMIGGSAQLDAMNAALAKSRQVPA